MIICVVEWRAPSALNIVYPGLAPRGGMKRAIGPSEDAHERISYHQTYFSLIVFQFII